MLTTALLALALGHSQLQSDALPMRPGGISLYTTTARIGTDRSPVVVHVYVVPTGRGGTQSDMKKDKEGRAILREEIVPGSSIPESPFYLDLFETRDGVLRLINSAQFVEDGDVKVIHFRWLNVRRKRTPIILVEFGISHIGEWWIFTYDRGVYKMPVAQFIGWGAEKDYAYISTFDRTDRQGQKIVREVADDFKPERHRVLIYRWTGTGFRGIEHRTIKNAMPRSKVHGHK